MKLIWKITRAGCASDRRMPGCERADFDAWDRAMRRQLGWRAGLAFWQKTNTGGRVLVSRHWPHKLCWSWSVWWSPYRGRKWDGERKAGFKYGYRQCELYLFAFSLSFFWQDYGDMVSDRFKAEAPVVRYPWGGIGGGEKGRLPKSTTRLLEVD